MERRIINSILDSDLYKFTMQLAVAREFPRAPVKYSFINRGKTVFPAGFGDELRNQIELMSTLRLTKDEHSFLTAKGERFLDPVYLDLILKGYQFDPREVTVKQEGGDVDIAIEGNWARTILWEVPLMATICELYYKMVPNAPLLPGRVEINGQSDIWRHARGKGERLREAGCKLSEFGTRRRHSFNTQLWTLQALKESMEKYLVGTSNVLLAMLENLTPQGTQAHEWYMYIAAKYGYRMANQIGLGRWVDVYGGDLGIALTDTFTTEDFFRNFDLLYANQFRGVRHDSGDPFIFMEKVIAHYKKMGIDPATKTIIFSDGLDVDLCLKLQEDALDRFGDALRIQVAFGIGTHLTNDLGFKPLNIVIKLVKAQIRGRWVDTVKLSDVKGKNLGPIDEINNAIYTIGT
jgi:nicotinate phosphoribosyltransferase